MSAAPSPLSTIAGAFVVGATLAILFLALLVAASSGDLSAVLQRPDALFPLLLLMLNLSGLFACAAAATALALGEDEPHDGYRAPRPIAARRPRRARCVPTERTRP